MAGRGSRREKAGGRGRTEEVEGRRKGEDRGGRRQEEEGGQRREEEGGRLQTEVSVTVGARAGGLRKPGNDGSEKNTVRLLFVSTSETALEEWRDGGEREMKKKQRGRSHPNQTHTIQHVQDKDNKVLSHFSKPLGR